MNKQDEQLAKRYLDALRVHLGSRRPSGAKAARELGRETLVAELGTSGLARMHELALVQLAASHDFARTRNGLIRRAGTFLAAALVPLEKTHRATRESLRHFQERAETLRLHTAAMARSNRDLRREVVRRKAGEAAVRRGREHYQVLFVESQFMQKKLRRLARQILVAQENERRDISRELHDEVVQMLVGINVQLAALGNMPAIGPRGLKSRIALTQRLVEKSVNAVHQFARELRPAVLDDLGLIPALRVHMKKIATQGRLKISLTAFAGVEGVGNTKRVVLYRVAQEALANVVSHAHASHVTMGITQLGEVVRMEVHDNGRSFRIPQRLSTKTGPRLGLLGMRERVEMVGGTLLIESSPGAGTTVRADIPFPTGAVA